MAPNPQDMAPNPRSEELRRVLAKVRVQVAQLEEALDRPHVEFTGKAVWVGPVARTFTEELTARRARLRVLAQRIIEELENELRGTPERVARSSAAW
ncbi:hypothetical protein Acor_76020 [Acrocarpospora corrugata]|uniref:Uncharacterized protein n=1 Tax=Acrocarpospora corrugata TaxID=35763 RepID=A0A5M3W9I6_9ACTN|nr:hypothetical protein [Acrocarpospora corrugata]GES05534.1 hypothetical protein Acor_76020 [Acrocarpospora corrugata]